MYIHTNWHACIYTYTRISAVDVRNWTQTQSFIKATIVTQTTNTHICMQLMNATPQIIYIYIYIYVYVNI